MQTQADAQFFLGAALMSFNGDDSRLITAGNFEACIWDTTTGSKIATIPLGHESTTGRYRSDADDTVIFGSDTWVKRYDLSGKLLNKFDLHDSFVCLASHGQNTLVVPLRTR